MGRKKQEPIEGAPKSSRVMRIDKAYFLSENDKGTLDGTEWMTRKEYAAAQARARVSMGEAGYNRGFSTSPEATAYRVKCGLLDGKVLHGVNLVKEYVGERPVRNEDPSKPKKVKAKKEVKLKKEKAEKVKKAKKVAKKEVVKK